MLIYNTKVESLRGLRIALDATCWLRSIQMLKDPYADALGGCSPGLFGVVSKELDNFARLNIHPIFVFDGMVPPLQHQMFQQSPGLQHLENAWTHLANNKDADAQKSFAVATSRINSDICHFVFHYLKTRGYECIRAPYIAGAQLAHMASQNIVQAVLGQPGLLLYGIKKVLLTVDFSKGNVEWIELDYILHQWGLNRSQLTDICLLAGTEYCLTYPYLNLDYFQQPGTSNFSFQSAVDFIKQMPLAHWMGNFPTEEMKKDHVNGYAVCKALIHHCPVLNMKDQQVESPVQPVPSDLHVLVGEKLPQQLYALLAMGHVSYRLPSVLSTGEWNDRQPPLVDSLEYRSLVFELEDYRAKTLGLLAAALPSSFKTKNIVCKTYFDAQTDNSSSPRDLVPLVKPGLKWQFTKEELQAELKRQQAPRVDLRFCLRWHAHAFETEGPLMTNLTSTKVVPVPSDAESLIALVTFMILETLDFVSEDGGMTVLGDVIKDAPLPFEESIVLAIEMMKFGILTGEPLEAPESKKFPAAVNYPTAQTADARTKSVMFISRVLSLIPMKLKNDLWSAKVDFDLASFHCLVRALNRSLRLVVEACLGNVLLRDLSNAKLLPLNTQTPNVPVPSELMAGLPSLDLSTLSVLPSFMLPRACLGIVAKFFLDYIPNGNDNVAKQFEADLRRKFPCAVDPIADLRTGFAFWDELHRVIEAIAEPLGTTDMLEEMNSARRILAEKQKALGL